MNGDGDILGTRRRPPDQGEPQLGDTSAGGLSSSLAAASPSKRQRLTAGGASTREQEGAAGGRPVGCVPVDTLNPEQLKRYRAWIRSRLDRGVIRELVLDRAAPSLLKSYEAGHGTGVIKETTTMAVSALAKMFVGDIVEEARRLQQEREEEGPLRPKDILEAKERLSSSGRSLARAPALGRAGRKGDPNVLGASARLTRGSNFLV